MTPKEETPAFLKRHKQIKETIDMTKGNRKNRHKSPQDYSLPRIVCWAVENPSGSINQCAKATGYSTSTVKTTLLLAEFRPVVELLYLWSKPMLLCEAERLERVYYGGE